MYELVNMQRVCGVSVTWGLLMDVESSPVLCSLCVHAGYGCKYDDDYVL